MKTQRESPTLKLELRRALVREVPPGFGRQQTLSTTPTRINAGLAREQHAHFVKALRSVDLGVTVIPADESRADSVWVADIVLLVGRRQAILCRPSSLCRVGEAEAFCTLIAVDRTVHEMPKTAMLEGSDVLAVGNKLYVGLSERTNDEGAAVLEKVAALEHLEVVRMDVSGPLRLRSVCASLGDDAVIHAAGSVARDAFLGFQHIPAPEAQGACLLAGPDWAIVPEEAPRTASFLERRGLRTLTVPMSEFLKRHGGPSRLCLVW